MTSLAEACSTPVSFSGHSVLDDISLPAALAELVVRSMSMGLGSSRSTSRRLTVAGEPKASSSSPLEFLPWIRNLSPDFQAQEDLLKGEGPMALEKDNIFRAMARHGMVIDNKVYFRKGRALPAEQSLELAADGDQQMQILNVYQLGEDVAGHKGLVHGGLTAAIIDETLGYLLYAGKASGSLAFDFVVTAQLNVTYLKPLPTKTVVACSASITSIEGRKIWVSAQLQDKLDGETTFATATALFIIPKA